MHTGRPSPQAHRKHCHGEMTAIEYISGEDEDVFNWKVLILDQKRLEISKSLTHVIESHPYSLNVGNCVSVSGGTPPREML